MPPQKEYREIHLTKGYVALVDVDDYEWATERQWYPLISKRKDGTVRNVYAYQATLGSRSKRRFVYLHREVLARRGVISKFVDHIDHNGLNNRSENLRPCSSAENNRYRFANYLNKLGFKGLRWGKNNRKWIAQLGHAGRNYYLGQYGDPRDAARAYDRKAIELFGEFALTNFPREDYL
jgi:hypothetical protein